MLKIFYLAVGGTLGTLARYFLSGWVYKLGGIGFPYGTLAVNVLGCGAVGFLAAMAEKKFLLGVDLRILLMAGFCGAFTTFSTFILETDNLIKDGEMLRALANVVLSVVLGFIALRLGALLGEMI